MSCQSASLDVIMAVEPTVSAPLSTAVACVRVISHGPASGVVLSSRMCEAVNPVTVPVSVLLPGCILPSIFPSFLLNSTVTLEPFLSVPLTFGRGVRLIPQTTPLSVASAIWLGVKLTTVPVTFFLEGGFGRFFACRRFIKVSCNVRMKCVKKIEMALQWKRLTS